MKKSDESKTKTGTTAATTTTASKHACLTSAPPPYHSVAFLGICAAIFIRFLPTIENLDETATIETFTHIVFPEYVTLRTLAYIRGSIAIMVFTTTYFVLQSPGSMMVTPYSPGSRLLSKPFHNKGIRLCCSFTSMHWNLLGLTFLCTSCIAFQASKLSIDNSNSSNSIVFHPWFLRTTLCLWEISAPCTILVSSVVRYAIWPALLSQQKHNNKNSNNNTNTEFDSTAVLKLPRPLLMHNANVLASLTEISLLGGLPVLPSHCCLAPLLGSAYVVFSWWMSTRWAKPLEEYGPQFIYYFLDTTVPGYRCTIAIAVLVVVLFGWYGVFCTLGVVLDWLEEEVGGGLVSCRSSRCSLVLHGGFVLGVASMVMRFRD